MWAALSCNPEQSESVRHSWPVCLGLACVNTTSRAQSGSVHSCPLVHTFPVQMWSHFQPFLLRPSSLPLFVLSLHVRSDVGVQWCFSSPNVSIHWHCPSPQLVCTVCVCVCVWSAMFELVLTCTLYIFKLIMVFMSTHSVCVMLCLHLSSALSCRVCSWKISILFIAIK